AAGGSWSSRGRPSHVCASLATSWASSALRAAQRTSSGRRDKASKTLCNLSPEAVRLGEELGVGGGCGLPSGDTVEVSLHLLHLLDVLDHRAERARIALVIGRGQVSVHLVDILHLLFHAAFHQPELGVHGLVEALD